VTKFMHTLAPALTEAVMSRALKRYFRRAAPAPYTHGSLFQPVPQGTGTSGGYRRQTSGGNVRSLTLAGLAAVASIAAAGALVRR
jgi:hypothetical protein